MAIAQFKTFLSTVTPWLPTEWQPRLKLLVDPVTGAPMGIQSQNGNGPDGMWTPTDVTAAQIAAPTALMIADLNAVYRLSVSPYTRYVSDGVSALVPMANSVAFANNNIVVPAGINELLYAPLTITTPQIMTVFGSVTVITKPA